MTFRSVSVPVDKVEPEVIQRRKSDCAPISPRDEAEILRGKVEKLEKKQENLAAELREKDSEPEDLGCWRALLAKVILNTSHRLLTLNWKSFSEREANTTTD